MHNSLNCEDWNHLGDTIAKFPPSENIHVYSKAFSADNLYGRGPLCRPDVNVIFMYRTHRIWFVQSQEHLVRAHIGILMP